MADDAAIIIWATNTTTAQFVSFGSVLSPWCTHLRRLRDFQHVCKTNVYSDSNIRSRPIKRSNHKITNMFSYILYLMCASMSWQTHVRPYRRHWNSDSSSTQITKSAFVLASANGETSTKNISTIESASKVHLFRYMIRRLTRSVDEDRFLDIRDVSRDNIYMATKT